VKKLLAVLVVSVLIVPFFLLHEAFSQDIWPSDSLITTGIGNLEEGNIIRAQNEAVIDAQKKALIQAVGMLMTFDLLEEQFFFLREAVFNRPAYYIENYRVLYDSTLGDRYHITIQSTIAFKKLEDDLVTSQFLTPQVKLPRILLMVAQQKLEQSFFTCWWSFIDPVKKLTITDQILRNELQKRGLEVIDHTYLIQETPLNKVYGCMDVKSMAIQTIGKQFNADIVIVGNSQVELTGEIEESHEKSVQASIIAKAVKVEDGLTVAILETYIPATEDDAGTAQRVALERAASDLAHQMSELISLRWTKESKGITLATLKVSGLSQYLDFSRLKSDLKKEIPEIQNLSQKTLSDEGSIIEVESTLDIPSLVEQIRSKQFKDFTISITEVSHNMIGMEVKIKSPEEEQPKTDNKNEMEKND